MSQESSKLWCITGADIFKDLSQEELAKISKHIVNRTYNDGEFVFMPGESEEHIFLVKQGEVEIYEANPKGKKFVIDRLRAGDLFGYTNLKTAGGDARRFARVRDCADLCMLPKLVFLELLRSHPEVALRVIEKMSERLEVLEAKVRDFALFDATSRLLREIERLAKKYGTITEEKITLLKHLTHEELSQMIGATRETTTKALKYLKQKGVIANDTSKTLTIFRKKAREIKNYFPRKKNR